MISYVSAPSETVQELTDDSLLFPGGRIHELHVHPDEVREAPRWVLASVINSALQGVSPILTAEEGAPLSFRLRPANLWGALVVQMAQSISGGTTFKKCERKGCSEYFAVTPQVARTNKKYCSDACKSGAWRSRTPKESRS